MKIYGNDKTHLTLSDKAHHVFSTTEPLEIAEVETEDGDFLYYVHEDFGDFTDRDMQYPYTEKELNEYLEDMYEEPEEE